MELEMIGERPSRKGQFIFMADRWNQWDLAKSRHVWLPLSFDSEKPAVRWHDRWSLINDRAFSAR